MLFGKPTSSLIKGNIQRNTHKFVHLRTCVQTKYSSLVCVEAVSISLH